MKTLISVIFLAYTHNCQSQVKPGLEAFDIFWYKPPAGWQITESNGTLTFSIEDSAANYCVITLSRSVETEANPTTNFELSWKSIAQENLGADAVTMLPASTGDGWETLTGSSSFEKDGLQGTVILVNSSNNKRMINLIILTNTDKFQKETILFLESLTLPAPPGNLDTTANSLLSSNDSGKPQLWALRKSISHDFNGKTFLPKTVTDYYVIYPNGDYLPHAPYEGLSSLSKANHRESWGKFTIQGTKGNFKNKYDAIAITKKSPAYMEREGYAAGFHLCLPVDGLRIEGAYTHVSADWGKDSTLNYLDGPGCQYTIYFKRDGTFFDKGVFSSLAGGCFTCNCQGGQGFFSIENFTITFRYDDGRVISRLFSAPPAQNPTASDAVYYVGKTAFYKKH